MNKVVLKSSDASAMVSEYESGMTVAEVAKMHGISTGKAYYILHDAGCIFRKSGIPEGYHFEPGQRKSARNGWTWSSASRAKLSEAKKCRYNGLNGYGHTKLHPRGYVRAYAPEHPRAARDGYVMLHTIIAERAMGRYLYADECVHHINHDRQDNRIENLAVMKKHDHMSMHMRDRRKAGVYHQ